MRHGSHPGASTKLRASGEPAVRRSACACDNVTARDTAGMPLLSSDALVLRTYKVGETSKVVVLLTRERGKVRAVAKGARGARPATSRPSSRCREVRVGLYGRQGAELFRLGECELLRSAFRAGARGLETALTLSYFAELLDAFAQEGEAEDAVYRLALAVMRAADGGTEVAALARYLEAWLLRLHGHLPPARPLRGLRRGAARGRAALPRARPRLRVRRAAGPPRARCCPKPRARFLREVFRQPPGALARAAAPRRRPLEAFHQELISRHLERDLRSHRVLRTSAREMRR